MLAVSTASWNPDDGISAHHASSRGAGQRSTALPPDVASGADRVLGQLDIEAAIGCGWWETETADLVMAVTAAGPIAVAFTAIAGVLRDGQDPDVVVGNTSAKAAFSVAGEWLDAGIAADQVAWWLRAGCWRPTAARALVDVGLRPWRLLDESRQPRHWVAVNTPDDQRLPLARAVAEQFMTAEDAVQVVTRRAR